MESENAKYLGITLDNKLLFTEHIRHITQKLLKGNSLLAKIRHYLPEKLLKNVYNAHIQPFLDYGSLVWIMASKTHLNDIEKLQDKSIRIISFKKKDIPTSPLYLEKKMLPLKQNTELATAKLFWQFNQKSLPASLMETLSGSGVLNNNLNNLN